MEKNYKLDFRDLIFACLYGLFFTHIILGIEKIYPLNTRWLLLPGSDYSYHYLAWEYFKDTPWTWPWGRLEGYAYPMYNSVMYTDSIPLLAFFFKLFRGFLPDDFQYFGLWYYLCYLLNGYFGIAIAKRIGYSPMLSWLISIFFTGAVVLVARFGHPALCGQWLVLWCIYIYISRNSWSQSKINASIFSVVGASSLIHPYLLFMVLGLTAAIFIQLYFDRLISLRKFGLHLLVLISIALFGWYSSGAFLFKGQLSEGLGKFSANLNTFVNAWDVGALGPGFNYFDQGQGEGIGYLGLAIIILSIFLLLKSFVYRKKSRISAQPKNYLFISCILFFIFSLSPLWTLGEYQIIDWKYNDYISRTFRGTGRFIWPLYYFILYWTFSQLYHTIKGKQLTWILILALVIQAFDLKPIWVRNKYVDFAPGPLPFESEIKSIISKANKVIVYPPYISTIGDFSDYIYFVNFAQHFQKPITTGYGARFPQHIGSQFRDSLTDLAKYIKDHPYDVVLTNVDSLALHKDLLTKLAGRSYQFERYRMFVTNDLLQHSNLNIDTNAYKTILNQYDTSFAQLILLNKENYIFGVIQQEGLGKLSVTSKDLLKSNGSKIESIGFGDAWLFGIKGKSILVEKFSTFDTVNDSIWININGDPTLIKLISSGHTANKPVSSIRYNDEEYSLQKRGLNLFVIDSTGGVKDKVNFDSYISDQFFSR